MKVIVTGACAPDAPQIDRAIAGGAAAQTVAQAFLAGYHAALRALVPELPERNVCLCATEEGGAHPRAIATTLVDGRITGRKKWVTGGPLADLLLVVVSTGSEGGRNQLRVARVDARAPGVVLHPMPETPFMPEIPHAEISFAGTPIESLLPGDGYDRYLKPFRTVEDAHVMAALVAYVGAIGARAGWPREVRAEGFAVLAALRQVALVDPSSRETHLVLDGALRLMHRFLDESAPSWQLVDEETRARWRRDAPLLSVAQKARNARAEAAWAALGG
jgi:alkylation response protein AidB-like acyl-CoA dehydrogenase